MMEAYQIAQKITAVSAMFIDGERIEFSDDEAHGIGLILYDLAQELKALEEAVPHES
jgi:hypothetical protein